MLWPTASCSALTCVMLHVHKPTALDMASLQFTPKLADTPEGCRTRESRRRVRVLGATWQQQLQFSMARRQVPFRAQSFNAAFLHLLCPLPLAKRFKTSKAANADTQEGRQQVSEAAHGNAGMPLLGMIVRGSKGAQRHICQGPQGSENGARTGKKFTKAPLSMQAAEAPKAPAP